MSRTNEYTVGDEVIVEVSFHEADEDGNQGDLKDPPTLANASIRWRHDDDEPDSRDLDDTLVTRLEEGVFATPVRATAAGRWYYRGESTSGLIAASFPRLLHGDGGSDSLTSVWLVTPAHRRYDLSEVCFAQHAWVAAELAKQGVKVTSCVVADDHNLVLARRHGFATVKRRNDYLGARWNDGYQFAAAERADFIVPLGSDSWIHPSFFETLPDPRGTDLLTGRFYAIVDEDGERMARLSIKVAGGVGPNVVPTWLLGAVGWRPVGNTLARGCDGSLLRSLQSAHDIAYKWRNLDPLQYVGWKSHGEQINSFAHLAERYGGGSCSPWEALPAMYPAELVDAARAVYKARGVARAAAKQPRAVRAR